MSESPYYKTRKISIKRRDLYFDVESHTYKLSKSGNKDDIKLADAVAADTAVDLDARIITRLADTCFSDLKSRLVYYLEPENGSGAEVTDALDMTADEFEISFRVSVETDDKVWTPIAKLVHNFLLDGIVADWYSMLGLAKGEGYAARLAQTESEIVRLLLSRSIPTITR